MRKHHNRRGITRKLHTGKTWPLYPSKFSRSYSFYFLFRCEEDLFIQIFENNSFRRDKGHYKTWNFHYLRILRCRSSLSKSQKFTWHFVDITAFLTPRRPACSLNSRVFSERLKWFKATNITSDILITISYHSYYYFKDTFVTFCLRHVSLFLLFYLTLVNSFIGYRMNGKWKTRIRVSGLQSVKYQITTVSPLQENQKT